MLLSRRLDDKEIQLKNQSQIYFQISGAGHEAVLIAAGLASAARLRLVLSVLSRSRAVPRARHDAARDAARRRSAPKDDPNSGGRQMPSHWGTEAQHPSQGQSRPARSACRRSAAPRRAHLRAASTAIPDRARAFHADEITYVSIGEGATSEGEFWESLNTACIRQLPVLFLIEDNGYAISVPVEVQTPGGDISRLVESFPEPQGAACDGTDFLASYRDAAARRSTACGASASRRSSTRRSSGRTRTRCPTTSGCTRRRRSARPKRERDPITRDARVSDRGEAGDRRAISSAPGRRRPRDRRGAPRRRSRAAACPDTAGWYVFSPDVDPTSAAVRDDTPSHRASPTRWSSAINRDAARTRWRATPHRRLRRRRRRREHARTRCRT